MAASRLQSEPASSAQLQDELSKLFAQQLASGRMLGRRQFSTPHGGAEPLDQPRLADDQAVSLRRGGYRAIAADEANTEVRRCLREQLCSGIAEAALTKTRRSSPARYGAMRANCSRNGACGRRSADVTVSRSGATSRSTSAL